MRVGRFLVQGVDVWLNNPRRPLEASGTSGMKAAQNGVPNVSVLDGWWDEGFEGDNGWAIGGRETDPDEAAQDWRDAQDLYRILEEEIVPAYYERDAAGLPPRWLAVMRRAMATALWRFSTTRMLHEYTEPLYLPAAGVAGRRAGGRAGRDRSRLGDRRWPPGSRSRSPSTTTSRSATSAGSSPRSSSRPTSRWSRRSSAIPTSASRSTTPGPLLEWLRAERPEFIARLAGARRARPGRDPRRRLLRAGPRLAARARPDRPAAPDGRRARGDCSGGGRPARGWPSASGSRTCRPRWSPAATTGRSSTTPTSGPRRSPRRTSGARTRPTTRASSCASSGPSRACATGSRSATSSEVIDYLRDHATEDGERIGMMGDDGEKFGAWPTTWEHCWGERPLGRALLRGARGQRRLADDDDAVGLAGRAPADRPRLRPDRLVRRDGRVGAAARREPRRSRRSLHAAQRRATGPEARWLRGAFWRNFQVKYREINDLHKQMLRTSAKVDAMAGRAGRGRGRSTTSTRASRTTATGTACSAASTSATCASRPTST